jgi:polysaccharide deacetylase family protein (PEP-CTERM system associated)
VDIEDWPTKSCEEDTLYLLDLFEQRGVTATFFVLAEVAEKRPRLVQEIHRRGHEVASHGWKHVPLYTLTAKDFQAGMCRSMALLSDLIGEQVYGFRAPFFSIVRHSYWALDVLMELGLQYDSSIFPFAGPRYGIPNFPRGPVRIQRQGCSITEVPLSTLRFCNRNWPVSGGGYFRLLPTCLILKSISLISQEGMPFVVYCHPYEFALETLHYPAPVSFKTHVVKPFQEFKSNLFRQTMRQKLTRVLNNFHFQSIREVLTYESK